MLNNAMIKQKIEKNLSYDIGTKRFLKLKREFLKLNFTSRMADSQRVSQQKFETAHSASWPTPMRSSSMLGSVPNLTTERGSSGLMARMLTTCQFCGFAAYHIFSCF